MQTQQQWAQEAYKALKGEFPELSGAPDVALVTFAFPSRSALAAKSRRVGECWAREAEPVRIFLHPQLWTEPVEVLAVLLHEMCHAALPPRTGHRAPFQRLAASVGLEKPWTATRASAALAKRLNALAARLPDFPAGGFNPSAIERKKQNTRLRLWVCGCGVKVRVASDYFAAHCDRCCEPFKRGGTA